MYSDTIAKICQIFLSPNSQYDKIKCIVRIIRSEWGLDVEYDLKNLLKQTITLNQLLCFLRSYYAVELPLFIRNHLRHLVHNRIITNAVNDTTVGLEICYNYENDTELLSALPGELSYVFQRINTCENIQLSSGWLIESRDRAKSILKNYQYENENKGEHVHIWKQVGLKHTSIIVAIRYIGMGHFEVIAFHVPSASFFVFREGGSNGFDQEDNFQHACQLTLDTIEKIDFWERISREC